MASEHLTLARDYRRAVHAAEAAEVDGEPEAQLTTPVATLFAGVARLDALGSLEAIRESRRDRIRPDFAFLLNRRFVGYGELKRPSIPVDMNHRVGWTENQRVHLAELDCLVVCNGRQAQLYALGQPVGGSVALPYDDAESWDHRGLADLLRRAAATPSRHVTSVGDLAQRLARRTASLRDRVLDLLEGVPPAPADAVRDAADAFAAWRLLVHPTSRPRDFADGVSQVVAYGLVMAALGGDADRDADGRVSANEARAALREGSPVIAASFGPLLDSPALAREAKGEIAALEDLCSAIVPDRIRRSADRRGEPWLYFYEDFLAVYDPEERKQTGVYYTPTAVVRAMVRITEHLLTDRFGRRLGFADPGVVTLDPATGTGTFPLAVLNAAAALAEAERGPAGPAHAARTLSTNLFAFELLPGPYGVAHLRIGQRLRALDPGCTAQPGVVLADTLESPFGADNPQIPLFGDQKVMAAEQSRARRIKADQRVTVVVGNPPYRRVDKDGSGRGGGGWVLRGAVPGRRKDKLGNEQSLFDDILDVAKEHTIFSHHASLYNLYVYFWRWAVWKAFEAHGAGPGIVTLITGSSWLEGPGFIGLRQIVRELADEGWVLDLGGDNKGAVAEENVFAIETPVAVVVLVRDGSSDRSRPANLHYRRVSGGRDEKLAQMAAIADSATPLAGDWAAVPTAWRAPMLPPTGSATWAEMPALTDLLPWQQPGCMYNRLWPIAPARESLEGRWRTFVGSPTEEQRERLTARGDAPGPSRETLFQTASSGRNIHTAVGTMQRLAALRADAEHQPIVRYGYRSYDRQWAFDDPRMAKTDSPALWQSTSPRQIFLVGRPTERFSEGPALVASVAVPDKHYFQGSEGGKDVLPLYRDREARLPNVTKGLLARLGILLIIERPSPEDLAAYVYALLTTPRYQQRFATELETPGPRVPITKDPRRWDEAVALGRRLLWLHTFAERYGDPAAGRGPRVPVVAGLGWSVPVRTMPATAASCVYDAEKREIHVGDGVVTGVRPEVWGYTVSRMRVVLKWLAYRTRAGAGRAASSSNPLDKIRPGTWLDEWNDELLDLLRVLTATVELWPAQADLLDRICDGPLVSASLLPTPGREEREPPATEDR